MRVVEVTGFGPPDVLVLGERPLPDPAPGRIRIRTALTSVNFADIKSRRGETGARVLPFVPGLDACGTVDAVGEGATRFAVGERVAAYTVGGSYAEYVLADERLCFALGDDIGWEQGAAIGILITSWNVLMAAGGFAAGESVLVHAGAGGVGSILVQLARAQGASRVFATVGDPAKAAVAQRLGADEVVSTRERDFDRVVNDLTGGRGVDLVLDSVSGATAERGMSCLAEFGRLVIYGHSGGAAARFDSEQLHKSNRAVIGYSSGGHRGARPEVLRAAAETMLALVRKGALEVLIGRRFGFADAAAAHELVEERRSVGKVLLEP